MLNAAACNAKLTSVAALCIVNGVNCYSTSGRRAFSLKYLHSDTLGTLIE